MEQAISACRLGEKVRTAAKMYGVCRTTLANRLKGKHLGKHGGRRKLDLKEEQYLVEVLHRATEIGIPFKKQMLKRLIARICATKGISHEFSQSWYRSFFKRNPQVSQQIKHAMKRKKQKEWNENNYQGWVNILSELHMDGYLDNPDGIFNLDESAFSVTALISSLGARRGTESVTSCSDASDQEVITVLSCGTAGGKMLRPLVLYDGSVHVDPRFEGTKDSYYLAVNSSEIMDCAAFSNYIRSEVIPNMVEEKNVVFVDGHRSHIYREDFLLECISSEKSIRVVCFPAAKTNPLQPFDSSVFSPMKRCWTDLHRSQDLTINEPVSKASFADILMEKWCSFNPKNDLRKGFRETGIYPFDPSKIDMPFGPVPKPKSVFVPSFETKRQSELAQVRDVLQTLPELTQSDVADCIKYIVQKGQRVPTQRTGI